MSRRVFSIAEVATIILLASVPLFTTFPYRVNIFISWEGAYRISEGQLPFRDFGTSLGGMFWVIPGIFFKIFGAKMITLVKAQVFINIISGLAFRSILKSFRVQPGVRLISVVLFCISYSFFNFWPWYNHTVIVYELIGLAFLLKSLNSESRRRQITFLVLSGLFMVFSFLTKQDAGAMGFMIGCVLLLYDALITKRWIPFLTYIGSFILLLLLVIAPFLSHGFSYWFNHGQPPHTARVSLSEILGEFFSGSQWIKFYLLVITLIILARFKNFKESWTDRNEMLFLILTICILGEAAIFQVTSYTPPDNNIFFHSFAFAFILHSLAQGWKLNFTALKPVIIIGAAMLIWWSSVYWKYIERVMDRALPRSQETVSSTGENVVNRNTYMLNYDTTEIPMSQWKFTNLRSFDKIYMPGPTVDGIHRLMEMDIVKNKQARKVLNLTELTPLAVEIPYETEKGSEYPLWHHLGVSMFNKQAEMYESRIASGYYDLVLFELIPNLNNFFPFRIRESLKQHYKLVDSFMAPRRGDTKGTIEVYLAPSRQGAK